LAAPIIDGALVDGVLVDSVRAGAAVAWAKTGAARGVIAALSSAAAIGFFFNIEFPDSIYGVAWPIGEAAA
jgi:hypothetical protein